MDGESATSLPVSRKKRGSVLEGSHLLKTPLPSLPNKSSRTLRAVGSWISGSGAHRGKLVWGCLPPGWLPPAGLLVSALGQLLEGCVWAAWRPCNTEAPWEGPCKTYSLQSRSRQCL